VWRVWIVGDQVDILELADRVFEGLSLKDIAKVEEMARRRSFFAEPPALIADGLRVQATLEDKR
jgi:hypothetical protein